MAFKRVKCRSKSTALKTRTSTQGYAEVKRADLLRIPPRLSVAWASFRNEKPIAETRVFEAWALYLGFMGREVVGMGVRVGTEYPNKPIKHLCLKT